MNPFVAHHLSAKIEKLNMKEEKETMSKFLRAGMVEI
jgi:small subunit ribosomal protein S19